MVLFPPGQRVPKNWMEIDGGNTAVSGRYFTKIGLDAVVESVHRSISADEKDEKGIQGTRSSPRHNYCSALQHASTNSRACSTQSQTSFSECSAHSATWSPQFFLGGLSLAISTLQQLIFLSNVQLNFILNMKNPKCKQELASCKLTIITLKIA